MPFRRPIIILLADDDEDDRVLAREALRDAHLNAELHTVNDGAELLDYLNGRGRHAVADAAPRPELILLDINMPRMDGHEALAIIKRDPKLRAIPVVVLTTSADAVDVATTYDLGGNSHIQKPSGYDGLVDAMRTFSRYWMGIVDLPKGSPFGSG